MVEATKNSEFDFFISHSSSDAEIAQQICMQLEESGNACWIAPRNIAKGNDYISEIMNGVNRSRKLIVLISKDANNSDNVANEVHFAQYSQPPKLVIPILISEIGPAGKLAYLLNFVQHVDGDSKTARILAEEILATNSTEVIRPLKSVRDDNVFKVRLPASESLWRFSFILGVVLFAIWFVVDMKGDHAAEIASLIEKHKVEIEQLEKSHQGKMKSKEKDFENDKLKTKLVEQDTKRHNDKILAPRTQQLKTAADEQRRADD